MIASDIALGITKEIDSQLQPKGVITSLSSCRISNMHNYFQVYCSGINLSAVIETFLVNVAVTILPIDMLRSWLGSNIDLDVSSFNYFPF